MSFGNAQEIANDLAGAAGAVALETLPAFQDQQQENIFSQQQNNRNIFSCHSQVQESSQYVSQQAIRGTGNIEETQSQQIDQTNNLQVIAAQLNETLLAFGFQPFGDLFSDPTQDNLKAYLTTVRQLLEQRQRDVENRQNLHETLRREHIETLQLSSQLNKITQKLKNTEMELEVSVQRSRMQEREHKLEKEKIQVNLKEVNSQLTRLLNRETQFANEIRKKEQQFKNCQEQLKKLQNKDKFNWLNSIELSSTLEQSSFFKDHTVNCNKQDEKSSKGMDCYENLREENVLLREQLLRIHQSLQSIHNQNKSNFQAATVRFAQSQLMEHDDTEDEVVIYSNNQKSAESMQDLLELKAQLFMLPKNAQELIDVLSENLKRFQDNLLLKQRLTEATQSSENIQQGNNASEGRSIESINSINDLKALLKNYRFVVEAQDKLIQKNIAQKWENKDQTRVRDLLANCSNLQLHGISNHLLDVNEMVKAKERLEEQKRLLEDQAQETVTTRNMISSSLKSLSEMKHKQDSRRRQHDNEIAQINVDFEFKKQSTKKTIDNENNKNNWNFKNSCSNQLDQGVLNELQLNLQNTEYVIASSPFRNNNTFRSRKTMTPQKKPLSQISSNQQDIQLQQQQSQNLGC